MLNCLNEDLKAWYYVVGIKRVSDETLSN
jgi:hypothetical protein